MADTILKIQSLTKYYGNILGVKDLSIEIKAGEVFGFIGPNGAGKSTTIRSIMNLIIKNSGTVLFKGQVFDKENADLKKHIGYLPSEVTPYEDLTVKEMLDYHETFYNNPNTHKRRCELIERLKLDESKRSEDLSLGNRKKLGIVLAFMHEPELIILDEPTSGLDPIMQQEFYKLLDEEKKKGTSIFYSTHVLSEIARICDRVGIIKEGTLLKVETIDELVKKNLNLVTVKCDKADDLISKLNDDVEVIESTETTVKFKNSINADKLIKQLSKYSIEDILIEQATLEDIFLHYYK